MAVWDPAKQDMESAYSHPWLAELLFALDTGLRRRQAVVEYSAHPGCIFRLGVDRSRRRIILSDGTLLHPDERFIRLHFWNEHVPSLPREGATIGWAQRMRQSIALSLCELAHYLPSRRDLGGIRVIGADVGSATQAQSRQLVRIMAHYGFETIDEQEPLPIGERLHRFGENVLISLIVLAQNARALRVDTLQRVRLPIFISRSALEQKFGGVEGKIPEA